MLLIADSLTKNGDRIGSRLIRSITPRGADKIYEKIIVGAKGKRLRQGEKAVALCRKAWRVVRRLYPDEFDSKTPNPWEGVTRERRVKKKTRGDARAGLRVRAGLYRPRSTGAGCRRCDLL
jgi:hypothetical protein